MSKKSLLLGVDVSTTGVKALLINETGNLIGSATTQLNLSTPFPLWSEQSPDEWWSGAVKSIRQVLAQTMVKGTEIGALGLTGQMHGLVLLDANNTVLRPAILWNDQRTGDECDEINRKVGFERLLKITGNRALTGFTAPKILWVRNHEPQIFTQTAHILLPKDYVRFRLSGDYAVDKADASGMLLLDHKARDWSEELLGILDIPLAWMPKTYEGTEVTGYIHAQAAEETGLSAGIPIVAGGGDQAAQAVGVGAVSPGVVALTLGTSGVIFTTIDGPHIEQQGRMHAFCHSVPGAWHFMGVMLSAAGSLQWYRDTHAPDTPFDELLAPCQDIPQGAEGLFFLPYLTGERTPYPDPLARAGFVGLTIRHSRDHMTRAVLEGVAFGMRDVMELIRQTGSVQVQQVRFSGGGAKSPLWHQILSDVLNTELFTVNTTEGAAYGAALLAGTGIGIWQSIQEACQATIHVTSQITPNTDAVERYASAYQIFHELYPILKPTFEKISRI
ncbi:MAG: xylulokinase [Anaerolineales bacterium]|nr:xylulokinase [Anaerolineales bacterium]